MTTPADYNWPRATGVFVTGTDTGVGKTVVSCAIVYASIDIAAAAFKPMASGCGPGLVSDDAEALAAACGLPSELVCPVRYEQPLAPAVAAELDRTMADWHLIHSSYCEIVDRRARVVVEGAGGLLVPLSPGVMVADLAAALGLPLIVVARAGLGTINHTLLTIEAAHRRGLRVAGVVISGWDASATDLAERTNPRVLARLTPVPVVAVPRINLRAAAELADAGRQIISACRLWD